MIVTIHRRDAVSKQSSGVECGAVSDGNTVTLYPQGSPHKFTIHPWPDPLPPHVIVVVEIVVSQNVYDDSRSSMRIAWHEFGTEELKVTWVTTDGKFVAEMKRLFQRKTERFCSIEQNCPVWKYKVGGVYGTGCRSLYRGMIHRECFVMVPRCQSNPKFAPHGTLVTGVSLNEWFDTPEQAIDDYRKRRQQDVAKLHAEIETEIGRLTKQAEDMR